MSRFVLAFELSGKVTTAALGNGSEIFSHDFSGSRGRALLTATDTLLQQQQATREDVGVILVGVGPGSYTGLRIACSAALTLSMALEIPAHGVNSFEAAAYVRDHDGPLHMLLDAYRKQVYHACYQREANTLKTLQEAQVIEKEEALERVGNGQDYLGDSRFAGHGSTLIGNSDATASTLLELAFARGLQLDGSGLEQALPPTPLYLRPAAFRS
ncbi:MAG: tRNA (adenosine(37)-N6)-threonylcarbamoyltransferase complex dimerization subunit type 1 TsaB [Planctomycetes bacterium]|nr:tRNA (adenosine(37)-N6)-threonylcarbamoyltransferase complex dimerization subunit type 1 TsaB [Planctomycetota bacterium]MCP4771443.1 tRNA (adenosine(37)-N6)-threonylcarbamoyltransferase complex dimerization subunit type 1 TsaB [Planctomycetota bacterium]MCP4861104.1 tRNA (adenosine(37)-N6)-threonylcarbamoyltransferase complex dimerization subunit type 1 TsaB [Planctomycetota bacterium]